MHRTLRVAATHLVVAGLLLTLASPAVARDRDRESDRQGRWLKIRVYEDGSRTPTVLVNLPMRIVSAAARVAAVAGACGGHVRVEGKESKGSLRSKDIDLEGLLEEIENMEAGQIVEIEDGEDRVSIWIE
ncbi:MAG: hypothetical protein HY510_02110 [Acidobacteria bacterium]|nr:hypothetical protein [Acidobacteriota bacterium]